VSGIFFNAPSPSGEGCKDGVELTGLNAPEALLPTSHLARGRAHPPLRPSLEREGE